MVDKNNDLPIQISSHLVKIKIQKEEKSYNLPSFLRCGCVHIKMCIFMPSAISTLWSESEVICTSPIRVAQNTICFIYFHKLCMCSSWITLIFVWMTLEGIEATDTQHTTNSLLRKLLPLCYQHRIHLTCFDNLMKDSRTSLVVQFLGNFKVS